MNLPIELWIRILDHVAHLPKNEIAAMARCSRFFNHQLRPRLFQTITLMTLTHLQSFKRMAMEPQNSQMRNIAAIFLRRKERHVRTEGWVPALHLVQNLGISISYITDLTTGVPARVSDALRVLAACPNVDMLFFDYSVDSIIGPLSDRPNITRLFFVGDNFLNGSILTERQHGFHNLTHLWVHDLRYFWSAVIHYGSTVAPDVFPALTHVVAGSDLDMLGCEDHIARAVREVLRLNQLQRFLFLFPIEDERPRIQTTPLWRSLVAIRDPRVCVIATPYPKASTWRYRIPIWRWNALTEMQAGAATWESGVPVWDGVREASEVPHAARFI